MTKEEKLEKFKFAEKMRLEAIKNLPKNINHLKEYYKPLPDELISKILKESDREEFTYKNYLCLIRRAEILGNLCGYVKTHPSSTLYNLDYGDIHNKFNVNVHGGLTFSGSINYKDKKEFFIGFDCGHALDILPFSFSHMNYSTDFHATYKDISYVRNELKSLVKEIIQIDKLGYCTECGNIITINDKDEEYKEIYHCNDCGHPQNKNELWKNLPSYLLEYRKEVKE